MGVQPKLYEALVEAAPDAFVVADESGSIMLVNAQTERLFGWSRDELLGKKVDVLVPERARHKQSAHRAAFLREGGPRAMGGGPALVGLRKDGVEFPVEVSLSTIEVDHARWVAASIRDVSDRRRAERALEEANQYLSAVVRECPVALLLIRDHGRRLEANAEAEHLLGASIAPKGGLAQFSGSLLWPDGTPVADEDRPSSRALRGEHFAACEVIIRGANGARTHALVNASPLADESGIVHGAVVAFEDINALKDLERLRVEWNAIVAHDLRQPLNTIALFAQLASRATRGDAELAEPIGQIMSATASLNRMIQDLLDLSRLEAHQLPLKRAATNVGELVARSVHCVEIATPSRRFELRLEAGLPLIEVDPGRIEQVVSNLLTNAAKYSPEGSSITVAVRRAAADIEVAVTNVGAGIPPEALPRLFQRFQRAADGKLAEVKGVGLGLYITRELVDAHGGRIWAESTPGDTTTFRFTLPIATSAAGR